MPTLAPIGTTPAPCGRLGSSGFARAPGMIDDVLVALHAGGDRPFHVGRIVDVDVVVDHDDMLQVHHRERGEQRVLAVAGGAFLIEITACQNAQPPSVTLMSLTCTLAVRSACRIAV